MSSMTCLGSCMLGEGQYIIWDMDTGIMPRSSITLSFLKPWPSNLRSNTPNLP